MSEEEIKQYAAFLFPSQSKSVDKAIWIEGAMHVLKSLEMIKAEWEQVCDQLDACKDGRDEFAIQFGIYLNPFTQDEVIEQNFKEFKQIK